MQPDSNPQPRQSKIISEQASFRMSNPFYEGPDIEILPPHFKERVQKALAIAQAQYATRRPGSFEWKMVVSITHDQYARSSAPPLEWLDYQMDFDAPSDYPKCPERYGYNEGPLKFTLSFIDPKYGVTSPGIATICLEFLAPEAASFITDEEEVAIHHTYGIYRAFRAVPTQGCANPDPQTS